MTRPRLLLLAVLYALLAAHLLFIPYGYVPLDPAAAMARFSEVRWAPLGADQNVAIASRLLMFMPLGVLLAAALSPRPQRVFAWPAWLVASVVGCAVALAINFAQIWFPARTVVLNLVVAQFAGVVGGAFAWALLGGRLLDWWRQLASGGRVTLSAALGGYVAIYLLASLAPYDFVTRVADLRDKLSGDLVGLWLAPLSCGPVSCNVRLLLEFALTIPLGAWFAMRRRGAPGTTGAALLVGFLVSLLIEGLQLLMVSGVSQGASLLTRSMGMAAGALAYRWRAPLRSIELDRVGRPLVLLLAVPYLALVAFVGGWFRTARAPWALAVEQAREIVWMPFFYLYYTPYTSVMQSLAVHTLLYVPAGVAVWLWSRRRAEVGLGWAAALAAAIAVVAETSKILLVGRHPDYGDVAIAIASATLSLAVLRWLTLPTGYGRALAESNRAAERSSARTFATPAPDDARAPVTVEASAGLRLAWQVAGGSLLAVALWSLLAFPVGAPVLAAGCAACAVLLWRWPRSYLLVLPAAIALLDLAPWSGRFFWDELDILLATTAGVLLLRRRTRVTTRLFSPLSAAALSVLALSVLVSTVMVVFPPPPIDGNAFTNYLSGYNALRVAKGYAWAGLLLWLVASDAAADPGVVKRLQHGLALGLLAAVASVLWERALFVGLADLHSWFRASGLASATHVGGAYLEMTLVALAPFALARAVAERELRRRILWVGAMVLSAAAVLMTLSRSAFAAWTIAVLLFAVLYWMFARGDGALPAARRWRWAVGLGSAGLVVAAVLLAQSTSLGLRLATSSADFGVRIAHWQRSLELKGSDALHAIFGIGLGSFPREFYLAHGTARRLPAYQLNREGDPPRPFLSLSGGAGMYIDQRVAVAPGSGLLLRGRLRSPQAKGQLSIALCEKSLLASLRCDWVVVPATGEWRPFEVALTTPQRSAPGRGAGSLVALSLSNGAFGTRVDVTDLSLLDGGSETLRNGSFAQGLDHWFMVSDRHLAWRAHSVPVQIWIEQGAAGVLGWLLLCLAVAVRLVQLRVPELAAAIGAAAAGMCVVGLFDSPLDSPRITILVALVLAGALIAGGNGRSQGRAAPNPPPEGGQGGS